MPTQIDPDWVSPERFTEYLRAADGDADLASRLYEWNAEVSSALFEMVHHFEVLMRNEIVRQLEYHGQSPHLPPGTPWVQGAKQIEEVEGRLKKHKKVPSAGRIYAGVTFGFWQNMFGAGEIYDELWRHALNKVFRYSRAERAVVATYLESVNQMRNRIAHHGSLVELDTNVEAQKIVRLAGWISPAAGRWIKSMERVTALSDRRPIVPPRNVVVVPGASAWPLYDERKQYAYLFDAGRSIKVVDRLAFYADQEIKHFIPKILAWHDVVDWNAANAKRLGKSEDVGDKALGQLIFSTRAAGWNKNAYQVLILSSRNDDETIVLPGPIAHGRRGRGSAFAKGHRYLRLAELQSARDTDELATS